MTKTERLNQLKDQAKFHKVLDRHFDAGWRYFVNSIRAENDISNIRMFKILCEIKGSDFVKDLIKLMSTANKHAQLNLTKKPKGILLKDNRFKTIPEIMIEKYPSGSYRQGQIYIQIRHDRWVGFVF